MKYRLIYALCALLGYLPRFISSQVLKQIAPRCWAKYRTKSAYIELIEDILISRA